MLSFQLLQFLRSGNAIFCPTAILVVFAEHLAEGRKVWGEALTDPFKSEVPKGEGVILPANS